MSLARFDFPADSSASPSMRPSAEASGIVRNARRKLLAYDRELKMQLDVEVSTPAKMT